MSLTPRQQAFAEEYVVDMNGAQAAIRAGYAPGSAHVTGSRLLANAKVAEKIEELKLSRSKSVARNAEDAIRDILRIAALAEKEGDLKTAMRGFELEAKHHGGFTDKLQVSGSDGGPIENKMVVEFVKSEGK